MIWNHWNHLWNLASTAAGRLVRVKWAGGVCWPMNGESATHPLSLVYILFTHAHRCGAIQNRPTVNDGDRWMAIHSDTTYWFGFGVQMLLMSCVQTAQEALERVERGARPPLIVRAADVSQSSYCYNESQRSDRGHGNITSLLVIVGRPIISAVYYRIWVDAGSLLWP